MSRTAALAATAALMAFATPGIAAAQDKPAAQAAPAATAPVRRPASAAERAEYERADALSRQVFWANEQAINPADPEAGVKLSAALRETGQFIKAAEAVQQTLIVQPHNVEAMLELGRDYIAQGNAFYGIAPLEQARTAQPNDWRVHSLLGVAYQQVKRGEDARTAWNEGLRLSPDNPVLLANAAMARITDGDAAGAETLLRRATAQPGASLQVRQNLALVLGLQGKTAEAENLIRRDLPPAQAERNLAWLRAQTSAPASGRTWSSLGG